MSGILSEIMGVLREALDTILMREPEVVTARRSPTRELLETILDQIAKGREMSSTETDMFDYDFTSALDEALEEAEGAEEAHTEIREIFASLTYDVGKSTDGKATMVLDREDTRDIEEQDGHKARLVVRSTGPGEIYERDIATFESTVAGYPVTLDDDETVWTCDDSDDLCAALEEIVRQTWVGKSLRAAMARTAKPRYDIGVSSPGKVDLSKVD